MCANAPCHPKDGKKGGGVMPYEVAVFLDQTGKTAGLTDQGKIAVFSRRLGKWYLAREREFTLSGVGGMDDLRSKMEELLAFLARCRIFVGSKINGIPMVVLNQANCRIREFQGEPCEFLDLLLLEEEITEHNNRLREKASEKPIISEISAGNYNVSIKEIQEGNSQITTKQALLPFLRQGNFYSLEIKCNHLPQWLEGLALTQNYTLKILKQDEGQMIVKLMKESGCQDERQNKV